MSRVRVRFAPSPTGPLHVGGARTALFNWLYARKHDGIFLVRFEDTDLGRSSPEWEREILDDLRWLGLSFDEGPDVGGPYGPYRQSERLSLYRWYADQLLEEGRAYRCFCTPEELEREREDALAAGVPPRYSGRCRSSSSEMVLSDLAEGRPSTVRFRVGTDDPIVVPDLVHGEVRFERNDIGDFVILKADGWPTYNFAAVVDDHLMEISHVIRGGDHLPNTPRQLLLYEAHGFRRPAFAHLPLILGPDRTPLSKRHGDVTISEFREAGYLPEALVNTLAFLGWSAGEGEEFLSQRELIERFDLGRVNRAPSIFDRKRLDWMNGHYIRAMDLGRLTELATPSLRKAGLIDKPYDPGYLNRVIDTVRDGVSRLSEIPEQAGVFFHFDPEAALREPRIAEALQGPIAIQVLEALRETLLKRESINAQEYPELIKALEKRTGLKGKALLKPIRAALTGKVSGPELRRSIPILGGAECLRRLDRILERLGSITA